MYAVNLPTAFIFACLTLLSIFISTLTFSSKPIHSPSAALSDARRLTNDTTISPSSLRHFLQSIDEPILDHIAAAIAGSTTAFYFHKPDILYFIQNKAASTAQLKWLWHGITGREWNSASCNAFIQQIETPCWQQHASRLGHLQARDRRRVLTSKDTLRVIVQREPYSRLISAFKSKFTCEFVKFGSDSGRTPDIITQLRMDAGVPDENVFRRNVTVNGKTFGCMPLAEYAELLSRAMTHAGEEGFVSRVEDMDHHFRPTRGYFRTVPYDLVLDVANLTSVAAMRPVYERLPFKDKVERFVRVRHTSSEAALEVPRREREKLAAFAALSEVGALKTEV